MINSEKTSLWPEAFLPSSGLYLVATPIGNLRDITLRALDVLSTADIIYCEDTRVSQRLLKAYGLKNKMIPYHDHSSKNERDQILLELKQGKIIALISDAGMPLISDPGYKLVKECREHQIKVYSVPGPNAALAAIQVSGLPTDAFSFYGFMPSKQGERKALIQKLQSSPETLVFYETASRLLKTLKDISDLYGDRICAVARELTKKFEDVQVNSPKALIKHYERNTLKGEIVLLIEGSDQKAEINLDAMITDLMPEMSLKSIASFLSKHSNHSKNEIYQRALELKSDEK